MEFLVEISPGELVDRLLIARMKEQACPDVAYVRKKRLKSIADNLQKQRSKLDFAEELETELCAVNLEIWELKCNLWDPNSEVEEHSEKVLEMWKELSDRRTQLKRAIDSAHGVESDLFRCYLPDRLENFALPDGE